MNAKMILAGRTCDECRFSWKSSGVFFRYVDSKTGKETIPKNERTCNYENIIIYRPKGMEMPMTKVVKDLHTCEKWEGE